MWIYSYMKDDDDDDSSVYYVTNQNNKNIVYDGDERIKKNIEYSESHQNIIIHGLFPNFFRFQGKQKEILCANQ